MTMNVCFCTMSAIDETGGPQPRPSLYQAPPPLPRSISSPHQFAPLPLSPAATGALTCHCEPGADARATPCTNLLNLVNVRNKSRMVKGVACDNTDSKRPEAPSAMKATVAYEYILVYVAYFIAALITPQTQGPSERVRSF